MVFGQRRTARAGSGPLPTDPSELPLCHKPSAPQLLHRSKRSPRALRGDRKASEPVTHQPLPIRWELDQAPSAGTK